MCKELTRSRKHGGKYKPDPNTDDNDDVTSQDMEMESTVGPVASDRGQDTSVAGEASVSDEQVCRPEHKERSASYEPPEASVPPTEQIAVPSPSPAAPTAEELVLAQISDISRSRDKTQEVEGIPTREVHNGLHTPAV